MGRRILFLARSLQYGGAERQLVSLVNELQRRGVSVKVALFYDGGALSSELVGTIELVHLYKSNRWDILPFFWRLCLLVRRYRPDVVHSYLTVPNIVAAALKLIFPRLRVVWGLRASYMDLGKYDWLWHVSSQVERRLSWLADLIIANSFSGKEHAVASGYAAEKIHVIVNGIDIERFRPNLRVRMELRKEWQVADDRVLIGLVGRIDPMKDHRTFLEAAAVLIKTRPNLGFVCVGDGSPPYVEKMQELARDLGLNDRLTWVGARSDVAAVYSSLDVLCLSSAFGEGVPNVVGEAMACGVPCVVTDVGDSARIVGEGGVVVPPGDPQALAYGCKRLLERLESGDLSDPTQRCKATRDRIVDKFSVQRMVEETLAVLKTVGSSSGARA